MDEPGAVVIDVRTKGEFRARRVKGARWIPYTEIRARAAEDLPERAVPLLLYCRTGRRSALAANELIALGYLDVSDFGGILRWNGPTERGD